MTDLQSLAWAPEAAGEALAVLARDAGLDPRDEPSTDAGDAAGNERWRPAQIEQRADALGIEIEPVEAGYAEVEALLAAGAPALLRVNGPSGPGLLALVRGGRRRIALLAPDLQWHRIPLASVCAALREPLEAPLAREVERLLDRAEVRGRRRWRARAALLAAGPNDRRVEGWLVRAAPWASALAQARAGRLPQGVLGLAWLHALEYALWLLSWWLVGLGALQGRLDQGWLFAWALLLFTLIPLRLATSWLEGRIGVGAGRLLRERLLAGALRLEPEEIRHRGAGQLLGCALEAQAVESLALSGGLAALLAGVELALALAVLAFGAGGPAHAALLVAWLAASGALLAHYLRRRLRWTDARVALTHELVEGMIGQRTRKVQQRADWHAREDRAIAAALEHAAAMDRAASLAAALLPRGWMLVGVTGLGASFASGSASPAQLAVALGGVLLAYRALRRLAGALGEVGGAAIAWRAVAPLARAASRRELAGAACASASGERGRLEAHGLVFRHPGRASPVLRGASVWIGAGERLLLEGPSGAGKSTLLSLLAGLRTPDAGHLLLDGLDRRSLGSAAWRRRVAAVPQFHENHVFAASLAFNLLWGRRWPPEPEDLGDAEAVCRELGLGELLERMPAGLQQPVGETGWQLSHGERSRVFLARALLQQPDLVLLDESFAALDPESLQRAIACASARARALLVVAHD